MRQSVIRRLLRWRARRAEQRRLAPKVLITPGGRRGHLPDGIPAITPADLCIAARQIDTALDAQGVKQYDCRRN